MKTYKGWAKEIVDNYKSRGGKELIKALREELLNMDICEMEEGEECESDSKR